MVRRDSSVANLGDYLPEDPAGAAVLAEAMAEKYAEVWEKAHGNQDTPDRARRPGGLGYPDGSARANEQVRCKTTPETNSGLFEPEGSSSPPSETTETRTELHQLECREALVKYNASADHPNVDDMIIRGGGYPHGALSAHDGRRSLLMIILRVRQFQFTPARGGRHRPTGL